MPRSRAGVVGLGTQMWLILLACVSARLPSTSAASSADPAMAAGLGSELLTHGSFASRLAPADDADLVLLYGGEEQGSLEPCGCPQRPRGGIARVASYLEASRERTPQTPVLMLNGGAWIDDSMGLDGQPRADVPVLNQWMVSGLQQLGLDALNLAYNDMSGITGLDLAGLPPEQLGLPVVSANVSGPGVVPWRIVEANGWRVGITGITTPGVTFLETPGFEVTEPVPAGRAAVAELQAEGVDVVVLLAYATPNAARKLALRGGIDVVIDTNLHRERYAPVWVGEAVWVRSHLQTMRLGELRLGLGEGRVSWAVDRKIDLDADIPDHPDQTQLVAAAREAIDAAQREVFGERY